MFSLTQLTTQINARLTEEQSLFSELWEYFSEKYFTPQYGDYEHITVGTSAMVSLRTIVFGFFIGINIAAILAIYNKRFLGDFVRTLISSDAFSPETAKTLTELGYIKNTTIRSELRRGATLRRVVKCVEEEEYLAGLEEKRREFEAAEHPRGEKFKETRFAIDFATAHFYIPEKDKYTAEIKFEKKGTNWLTFAAVFVLSLLLVVLMFWLTPEMLQMLDNFLSIFG